eukprot:TRINITY_DN21696_c0_g1_i1.p1 TRINITY_DN21696_c0_g1~~TRINITY_DN21696_c0_g1_i1.p1  ORF type:complete len:225 (-),score=25.72 TRINITY_DN21696_c0_g1_i1:488-1162(-)
MDEEYFKPEVLVSGGQTGGDSIAIASYEALGIKLAGYFPRNFARSDGRGAEIAKAHPSLLEGQGGNAWRDKANAAQADACLAFLTTAPNTGRGTTSTVRIFTDSRYEFLEIQKPAHADWLALQPRGQGTRPALVFWDIDSSKVDEFVPVLRSWLADSRPPRLMVSGPLERTLPGVEAAGTQLLLKAMSGRTQVKEQLEHATRQRRWPARKPLAFVAPERGYPAQ